jgi:uncharacterized protein (DUF1697 family)
MINYICILRGINVSGKNKIIMSELCELFKSLNFSNVKTYIQSGNISFCCFEKNISELVLIIKKSIKDKFKLDIPILILKQEEISKIMLNCPYLDKNEKMLHLTFLENEVKKVDLSIFEKFIGEKEEFLIVGSVVYLYLPNGYGTTKLNNNFFEKKLNVICTTRNWKTINKLKEL